MAPACAIHSVGDDGKVERHRRGGSAPSTFTVPRTSLPGASFSTRLSIGLLPTSMVCEAEITGVVLLMVLLSERYFIAESTYDPGVTPRNSNSPVELNTGAEKHPPAGWQRREAAASPTQYGCRAKGPPPRREYARSAPSAV